jgi:hypothetical protein
MSDAAPVCTVNNYINKMKEILVQLLDTKDKQQTLTRLANLKQEMLLTLKGP